MSSNTVVSRDRVWTRAELRKLPARERDRILRAAAVKARKEYLADPQLTAFEAFGPEHLHGGSAGPKTR
jgi:hypothetical protein